MSDFLHEVSLEVLAELEAQHCPYPLAYGPERFVPTTVGATRIQVDHVREPGADPSGPPRVQQKNPRAYGARQIACVVRVYAQSDKAGADIQDHDGLAGQLATMFDVALYKVVTRRKNAYTRPVWGFLGAEALKMRGLEAWPGSVYEARFVIEHAELDTVWTGESTGDAAATGNVADVETETTTEINAS